MIKEIQKKDTVNKKKRIINEKERFGTVRELVRRQRKRYIKEYILKHLRTIKKTYSRYAQYIVIIHMIYT